jgi:hypothetical protein
MATGDRCGNRHAHTCTRSVVHPIALEIDAVQGEPPGAQPLERLLLPVHDVRLAFLPLASVDIVVQRPPAPRRPFV